MKLTDFLKDKLLMLMLHVSCMLLLAAFLHVTGYPDNYLNIIFICWGSILLLRLSGEYLRRKKYWGRVLQLLEQTEQKYLLGELMPPSFALEDVLYQELLRQSNKSAIEQLRKTEDAGREYREYIESWVHEIKAPIMNAALLCEKGKAEKEDELFRSLLRENAKIENYVDMALFYARSDQVYQDYLIKESCLQETAEEILKKNKYYLIQHHIHAQVQCRDVVYTDVKWIAFILNQLVLNAVKYRQDTAPEIRIFTEKRKRSVRLTVWDNGLGIPDQELPRIFSKGFTGSNGRSRGRSTGMGLYLCRKLCLKLGLEIYAESEEGKSTSVILEFPVGNYLAPQNNSFKKER